MTIDMPAAVPSAVLISAAVALVAWRARSLTASGALAAVVVGSIALRASWGNGALLLIWFALAALLSAFGKQRKAHRVRDIVEKAHGRDAWQVLANGATFAFASLGIVFGDAQSARDIARTSSSLSMAILCSIAAAGALAAAGADTWATEIGTLYGRAPWSLRSRSPAPVGTSGAITPIGTVAMFAGAITIALVACSLALDGNILATPRTFVSIAAGGVAGAFFDTLIGAWVQERRWCPRCNLETEQTVHTCGTATAMAGGFRPLNNDAVNLVCTLVGALVAVAIAAI